MTKARLWVTLWHLYFCFRHLLEAERVWLLLKAERVWLLAAVWFPGAFSGREETSSQGPGEGMGGQGETL